MKKPYIVIMEKVGSVEYETRRILVFAEDAATAMQIMRNQHYHYWIVSHAMEHDTSTLIQVH